MGDDDIRALATDAFARFNESDSRDAFFDAYDPDVALHGYPGALQGIEGLRRPDAQTPQGRRTRARMVRRCAGRLLHRPAGA